MVKHMVLRIQLMLNIVVACKGSSERIKGISLKHISCFDQCLIAIPNLYVLFFFFFGFNDTLHDAFVGGYTIIIAHWSWHSLVLLGRSRDSQIVHRSRYFLSLQNLRAKWLNGIFCACLNDLTLVQRGVQLFLQWAMMQGVAMLLQNRYQRQRLYTRIALGKVPFPRYSA